MTLNEFGIIKHYFMQQTIQRDDVMLGIGDDCALLEMPKNQQLAITMDTLVAGVHFSLDTSAYDIGYKALAVNLSDLASMGATPAWITLALTLPEANESWLHDFCRGIFSLATSYSVQLIGGDLTQGPLTITIQAHGFTPPHQALKRSAAKPGDLIYVTNTLGDAALGLLIQQQKLSVPEKYHDYLFTRLNRPEPRVEIGEKLRGIAHAAIDISDGLLADLNHILEMSHTGARINVNDVPLSDALRESLSPEQAISLALGGGDDYELCFTVPKDKTNLLASHFTCIGIITEELGLDLQDENGNKYNGVIGGYKHF